MGDFISVQHSEWACSRTKFFEWRQILFGVRRWACEIFTKAFPYYLALLNQSKSNRLMLKRDSHNLNTNWRCSTWQGWSIGDHKQIVCSIYGLCQPHGFLSMEVMSTYLSRIPPWREGPMASSFNYEQSS
jgi:hypothetical protein